MPLEHSASDEALHRNMHTLMHDIGKSPHVQSREQAIAIALSTQRHAAAGKQFGGLVAPEYAIGGMAPGLAGQSPVAAMQGLVQRPMTPMGMGVPPLGGMNAVRPLAAGGAPGLAVGGFDVAKGLVGRPPFMGSRQLHVGPVVSAVPGRTDSHKIKVPSGSYVLPAETISHMGQSNSVAGLKRAQDMFGSGPYGMRLQQHMAHPHFPHLAIGGSLFSEGGARGEGEYEPVDVDVSGGEYIIPPWEIERRWGNVQNGHKVLDDFVLSQRAEHAKTIKNLPPPAKD